VLAVALGALGAFGLMVAELASSVRKFCTRLLAPLDFAEQN
jgi:hypothetical protein